MAEDHKERYYVGYDEVEKVWDVWQNDGSFFPSHIANCDTLEEAKLVRDALESFPKEIEDYL